MPWLGTFHSIGVKILRMHAELVGLRPNFTILDTDDQLRLLKQILQAENLDDKRWPARALASLIDGWKNRGLDPQHVPASESAGFAGGRGAALYALYQARLKALNAVDFGDLLLESLRLFREHGDVLAGFQRRFRYILVDEYQDTNVVQYLWLRLLARADGNLCCVGDDDQSIYGWRGADVDNILRFEKDFPGAKVIRLERNYRSGGHILAVASGLIAHNRGRLGKTLFTDAPMGDLPTVTGVWDSQEEARVVGEAIEAGAAGRRIAGRHRHTGPRLLPDARIRGALHRAGPAVPGDRRSAILRAGRDSRRARLSALRRAARRRPRVRADLQPAASAASANRRSRRCTNTAGAPAFR